MTVSAPFVGFEPKEYLILYHRISHNLMIATTHEELLEAGLEFRSGLSANILIPEQIEKLTALYFGMSGYIGLKNKALEPEPEPKPEIEPPPDDDLDDSKVHAEFPEPGVPIFPKHSRIEGGKITAQSEIEARMNWRFETD
jgi:hypothetical protein